LISAIRLRRISRRGDFQDTNPENLCAQMRQGKDSEMNTTKQCPDDQNNVPAVNEEANKPDSKDNMIKPYRVTLRANLLVDVDVWAESEAKARAKAFDWNSIGTSGYSDVGSHFWTDDNDQDHLEDGGDELYWKVIDGDHNIVDAVELDGINPEGQQRDLDT
jgi:hypothetical protein